MNEETPLLDTGQLKWSSKDVPHRNENDGAKQDPPHADFEMHIQIQRVAFNDEDSSLGSADEEVPGVSKEQKAENNEKQTRTWHSKIDKNAFQFALRMGVMLTFTSLFVLVRTPKYQYPAGMWVLVSTLFVCWFPALDAASVIEKIVQRLIGTFVGAFLGLGCGFASLLFSNEVIQSTFIGFCMFIFCFFIIFLAGQCKVGQVKVIRKYAYATICKCQHHCPCTARHGE